MHNFEERSKSEVATAQRLVLWNAMRLQKIDFLQTTTNSWSFLAAIRGEAINFKNWFSNAGNQPAFIRKTLHPLITPS